jgi:hypothetical protein
MFAGKINAIMRQHTHMSTNQNYSVTLIKFQDIKKLPKFLRADLGHRRQRREVAA